STGSPAACSRMATPYGAQEGPRLAAEPLLVLRWWELLDGSLELRTGRQLDAVARGDLDLGARLRVAARARGGLGALGAEEAGDRDLVASGDSRRDLVEERVEH